MFTLTDHIYSLTASIYILSCLFFAAVRYFHVCHEYQGAEDYYLPDRQMGSIFYLMAVLLLPYTFWPSDEEAWLLVKGYYLVLHPWFCSVLLFNYFGKVKAWYRWKLSAQFLSIPLILAMVLLTMLAVWPGVQLDGQWQQTVWVGVLTLTAVTVVYCGLSIWKVRQWIVLHSDDDYSNDEDFPSQYARRVVVLPLLHTLPIWAIVAADSRMAMAAMQAVLVVFNIAFLIYVLHTHRTLMADDIESQESTLAPATPSSPESGHQPITPETEGKEESAQKDEEVSTNSVEAQEDKLKTEMIKAQIHHAVVEQRLFLKPHLTLEDVAAQCSYGRTYLSKVFKQELGGFFNYVNGLRLDYADEYMRTKPMATLEEVASASGFTSRQAFYSVRRRLRPKE